MDNTELRQLVIDELDFQPAINAAHIGVAVENGIVTLTGYVTSYHEKIMAEQTVQRMKGVRGIVEEIEVRFPDDKKTADDEIAARALKIIEWDTLIPADSIKVKVQRGWITLRGEVDWQFQRKAAEDAVRRLSGIFGVTNLITIRERVQVGDVKRSIETALRRDAEVEANQIRVLVNDGKVVLEGRVHSWYERSAAERAAWSVPGVTSVVDHLAIT